MLLLENKFCAESHNSYGYLGIWNRQDSLSKTCAFVLCPQFLPVEDCLVVPAGQYWCERQDGQFRKMPYTEAHQHKPFCCNSSFPGTCPKIKEWELHDWDLWTDQEVSVGIQHRIKNIQINVFI